MSAEKKCLLCGGPMVTKRGRYDYGHVLPGVVLVNVLVSRCKSCGETEVAIPRIEDLHRQLAWKLVEKKGRLTPREVRYLRKQLGFSGADFAAHMGTRPESVSRWENGAAAMGAVADRLLRLMVVHKEPVKDYSLEALKGATTGTPRKLKVQMKAGPARGWKAA